MNLLLLPAHDFVRALSLCLRRRRDLAVLLAGLVVGWMIYVPVHELLHAAGCLVAGGSVSRLELAPIYGGTVLARFVPWVVAGGEYAGRLSGFDTGGSDAVYLVTDLAPFVPTVLFGVWALRRAARRQWSLGFGITLPWALAPFLSLSGDAYELGSILITRLPSWRSSLTILRGDDLGKVFARLAAESAAPWGGFFAAVMVGLAWAIATYGLGGALARLAGEPALSAEEAVAEVSGTATTKSSTANCQ